jgi:hypothetical protein
VQVVKSAVVPAIVATLRAGLPEPAGADAISNKAADVAGRAGSSPSKVAQGGSGSAGGGARSGGAWRSAGGGGSGRLNRSRMPETELLVEAKVRGLWGWWGLVVVAVVGGAAPTQPAPVCRALLAACARRGVSSQLTAARPPARPLARRAGHGLQPDNRAGLQQ